MRKARRLSTEEIKELAMVGKLVENYYGKAYDIEFGIDAENPMELILSQLMTGKRVK
jgi:phosphoenolpyruvate synthase/pyruvate phosphate dikinase